MIGRYMEAMSPIDMFNSEQRHKLAQMQGFGPRAQMAGGFIKDAFKSGGPGKAGIGNYFTGHNIGQALDTAPGALKFKSIARRSTAIGAGLYFGGQLLFGNDNLLSNTIGFGAKVGMHAGAAVGLGKYVHPLAGAAYAGLGLFNMFRSGSDHMGPF